MTPTRYTERCPRCGADLTMRLHIDRTAARWNSRD